LTPQEYERADNLFHKIRELPESERAIALDRECAGDAALRAHVVWLLDADAAAATGPFLARPAIHDAAQLLTEQPSQDPLPEAGTVIGNYRLGARIGTGGMGVVYEAEDLRLNRRVAVKILPLLSVAVENQERIQRFQREARAASQLNHPHIASIFDAGFDKGSYYIAMELVEGHTLRAVIAQDRTVDAKTVLEIIGQTASALSAAHGAGIVHRDIKPENIKLRPDGFVKVLDFGLAQIQVQPGDGAGDFRTRPGHVAGTLQYLSPEQVLGKPATPRSDLFSLGVVAYELATGVRPFDGPTDGAIFDAILHHQPKPPSQIRPALGSELDALIMDVLEKDPELRFQSAADLRSACKRLARYSTPSDAVPLPPKPSTANAADTPSHRSRIPLAVMAAAAVAIAVLAFLMTRPVPQLRVTGITTVLRDADAIFNFVTDGARLYYGNGKEDTGEQFFEVSVKGGEPVPRPQLNGMFPFDLAPDGSEILLGQYLPGTSIGPYPVWLASTVGNAPRRLGGLTASFARWSPKQDRIVYASGPELRVANSDGSGSRVLAQFKGLVESPAWSPDGRIIRFTLLSQNIRSIWEVESDGSRPHSLFPDRTSRPTDDGVWTRDGKYFFFVARQATQNLWSLLEGAGFVRLGKAESQQLTAGPMSAILPYVSPNGRRIFFKGTLNVGELVQYDHRSSTWTPYLGGMSATFVNFSGDGRWIAYVSYPDGAVWRSRLDGSERLQLTQPPLRAISPRWSPDGSQIVFFGFPPDGQSRIYLVPSAGGAVEQISHGEAGSGGDVDPTWSPDGTSIAFGANPNEEQRASMIAMLDLKTRQVRKLPGSEALWSPKMSPDGRHIATLAYPEDTLWLYNLNTQSKTQLTTMTAGWQDWSPDSQYIYCENNTTTEYYRVRVSDKSVEPLASLAGLKMAQSNLGWLGHTPDGTIISTRDAGGTAIYALDWEER
jgi:serine/threonine protein kinase/Tol biopolymer transport system component